MNKKELKQFLDEKVDRYNNPSFIKTDPILIPHQFSIKEDIEITAFLTATIAWGKREMIIRSAKELMNLLGNSPYDFIVNYKPNDLNRFNNFKYRTFNEFDIKFFLKALKNIYLNHGGLENIFKVNSNETNCLTGIENFRKVFFSVNNDDKLRTFKHVSSPQKGSAAKRLNMFLRWMVRNDRRGVDFGIWKEIKPFQLSCPLDVHSGNVARKLGLLTRKQNDWKAVIELDNSLRNMDINDPVKYDFALFGLGVFEGF